MMILRFVLNNNFLKNTTILNFLQKTPSTNPKLFSKKACNVTLEKRKSILSLFENYGFTETQISNLIKKRPVLLTYNVNKTLKPKLGFFNSIGVSPSDLMKILSADPPVLRRSLDNQIVPSYLFLKTILQSDENVTSTIIRSTWVLKHDLQKYLAPNIALLRYHGVPDSRISSFVKAQPRAFMQIPDRFREVVDEVKEMGFDSSKRNFLMAILGLTGFSKSTWDRKFEVYRKWGWSNDEIRSAIKRTPYCMACSEKKIDQVMDFLVNKMGWDASDIARCPAIILSSLDNYIVPRCLVVQVLLSNGAMKKDFSLSSVILSGEKRFLKKFVTKYLDKFPELLDLFHQRS